MVAAIVFLVGLAAWLFIGSVSPGGGTFQPTGSMLGPRAYHTAAILPDGRVLVAGGYEHQQGAASALASAEIFDPASGTFIQVESLASARIRPTSTLLRDGRVLIVGGYQSDGDTVSLRTAELFDQRTGLFDATGGLTTGRSGHTATLLPDGRVLVTGGTRYVGAELFDPATGTFSSTGPMTTERSGHTATLLDDGRVLVTGGVAVAGGGLAVLASAEVYDPGTGMFTATAPMASVRTAHTSTLLADGRVLIAGRSYPPEAADQPIVDAELYDPVLGSFRDAGPMGTARDNHTATLLSDGRVLIAGGTAATRGLDFLASAELFDPETGSFTTTVAMEAPHWAHTATLLGDGSVLVTGGQGRSEGGVANFTAAELFVPEPAEAAR